MSTIGLGCISRETLQWLDFSKGPLVSSLKFSGGDRGIRTPDFCDANAALSQLSYIPASILATVQSRVNSAAVIRLR
jgi:hypothetical protein